MSLPNLGSRLETNFSGLVLVLFYHTRRIQRKCEGAAMREWKDRLAQHILAHLLRCQWELRRNGRPPRRLPQRVDLVHHYRRLRR